MTQRHLPRWSCATIGALICVVAPPAVGQDEVLRAALTAPVPDYTTARTAGPSLLPRNNTARDPAEDRRAALGRLLFYDRRLSRNQTVSCSSCHEQQRAFADGSARSRGFAGRRTVRNSMSIVNLRHGRIGGDWHHPGTPPSAPPGGPALIVSPEPDPSLALDRRQRADLVAFLKTLTDRELLHDPRFADPLSAARTVALAPACANGYETRPHSCRPGARASKR